MFTRKDYRAIFDELAPMAAVAATGQGVDLSQLEDSHPRVVSFMRAVLLQDVPQADPIELVERLRYWRLERTIDAKRDELERLDPEPIHRAFTSVRRVVSFGSTQERVRARVTEELEQLVKDLASRGKQRGFLTMAEVQQDLEDAQAPPRLSMRCTRSSAS